MRKLVRSSDTRNKGRANTFSPFLRSGAHHDNLRKPRLVFVLWVLEVDEYVDVDDEHEKGAYNRHQDEKPVMVGNVEV